MSVSGRPAWYCYFFSVGQRVRAMGAQTIRAARIKWFVTALSHCLRQRHNAVSDRAMQGFSLLPLEERVGPFRPMQDQREPVGISEKWCLLGSMGQVD